MDEQFINGTFPEFFGFSDLIEIAFIAQIGSFVKPVTGAFPWKLKSNHLHADPSSFG